MGARGEGSSEGSAEAESGEDCSQRASAQTGREHVRIPLALCAASFCCVPSLSVCALLLATRVSLAVAVAIAADFPRALVCGRWAVSVGAGGGSEVGVAVDRGVSRRVRALSAQL